MIFKKIQYSSSYVIILLLSLYYYGMSTAYWCTLIETGGFFKKKLEQKF